MTAAPRYVYRLAGEGRPAADVGGKAGSLDRLVAGGFAVPATAAITADAYRDFVGSGDLEAFLKEVRASSIPPPAEIEGESKRIEQAFLAQPIPRDVENAIVDELEAMLKTAPVAVRSSATAEDLGSASFAGQYRTTLGVASVGEALAAIRRCWASLWLPSARAYRAYEEISEDDLAMAVIIQSMVPAEWSGVLFTRDPQGEADEMRIEAVPGLGDDLVSGRVTPRDFAVARDTLAVRARDGGTSLAFLEDLARIGLRIERLSGEPQDVEWAYADGEIAMLQARPITVVRPLGVTDDGFDSTPFETDEYTPRGIGEMLPDAVTPLIWSINAPMLNDAFRTLFAAMGVEGIESTRGIVCRYRARAALNLSVLRDVAAALPGGSAAEVERQYLGQALSEADDGASHRTGWSAVWRTWRARRRLDEEVQLVSKAAEALSVLRVDTGVLPASALLAYRRRVRDLAWRIYAAEVAAASAAGAAYRALELVLARWLDDDPAAEWAQRLTTGALFDTAVGSCRLSTLAGFYRRHVATNGAVRDALVGLPGDRAPARIAALGDTGQRFLSDLDDVVRGFGSLAVYGGPTWEEAPDMAWGQLIRWARFDGPPPPPESGSIVGERALAEVEQLILRRGRWWWLVRIVTGQVVDLRRRWLRRMVADAVRYLGLRESAKTALLVLGGSERRVVREIVHRLVVSGHLEREPDAALIGDVELEAMLSGRDPVSRSELARRRAAHARAVEAGPLPAVFAGHPEQVAAVVDVEAQELRGWAASPGRVNGTARVVHSLAECATLQNGEILVAHNTDPSWTPVFLATGGIVLEEGGPLSHAAIVAREFGLPAVLNVPDVMRIVSSGELLQVDGTAGTVRRLELDEAS